MVPKQSSSTIGLVAITIAAITADYNANGFVSPRGTVLPSQSSLHFSFFAELAEHFNNWGKSSNNSNDFSTDQYDGVQGMDIPETSQFRREREAQIRLKFASGDELYQLRDRIVESKQELVDARIRFNGSTTKDERLAALRRINELGEEIHGLNGRDAEFVYSVSSELMEKAISDMNVRLAEKYRVQMEEARLCIPQLNMDGMWVGRYEEHGYELINVTYSGDTLIATKVTGDENVPKGEITFTVDLAPKLSTSVQPAHATNIEPIELNPHEESHWGKQYLPRHLGKGQEASKNFTDARWMEGQMILVNEFFSFTWFPLGRQIFFTRSHSELTEKLLQDAKGEKLESDPVSEMRGVAQNMMEETYWFKMEEDGHLGEGGVFE